MLRYIPRVKECLDLTEAGVPLQGGRVGRSWEAPEARCADLGASVGGVRRWFEVGGAQGIDTLVNYTIHPHLQVAPSSIGSIGSIE